LANPRNSIWVEREGDSNEMDESDLHDSKQDDANISIEDAIVISVEFAIENTNQKSMANDKSMIPAFNLA
jgi:hypothetical protein